MKPFRNLKASSVIQEELAALLERDYHFEGALVTVMDVQVDEKLLHAVIKVGIIPYEKGPDVYRILTMKASDIRYHLLKRMNIKPMPFLKFAIHDPARDDAEPAA